ncbi:class I SAM-dependent methyltransferase [Agrobacterium sp. BA1120]|uniref:class I SAM-dependent methyltransferase n=1 Tax=Agrobacterium sp. BA1120 TaxID=3228927 RepID=UPI00336A2E94
MSGFDKDWLRLREPADRNARSVSLLDTFTQYLSMRPQPQTIMDIGCGTGSTYRSLSPLVPGATWKLLDYEVALLDEAQRQIGAAESVELHRQDLNHLEETLLDGVDIVTASALFDLCSAEFCNLFVEKLAARKIGLYAALNYDGKMEWTVPHPLDGQIVEDFNQHQRSDKGFGPALGPDASDHLSTLCRAQGFSVKTAESPWQLGPDMAQLQTDFLAGLQRPIHEIGNTDDDAFNEWLEFRLSHTDVEGSVCIVGHTDFLAVPHD